MQNLLTSEQMRATDAFNIKNKCISSIELMEDASNAFVNAFIEEVDGENRAIAVLCGKGNNGADGLAIARILRMKGYTKVAVYLIEFSAKETAEYAANLSRLEELEVPVFRVTSADQLTVLKEGLIIDAILGSGLNKALKDNYKELAEFVNALNLKVIAVDVPTGFPAEGELNINNTYLKADLVICFQRPKINFFFPESLNALKSFLVVDIGLDENFIQTQDSAYQLTEISSIKELIKPRLPFSHKGTYGHALIVAGETKTMGAALLASKACLHGGAGLTTASIPESGLNALNTSLPEVMYIDRERLRSAEDIRKFKAIAIGPGLGTDQKNIAILRDLVHFGIPLVIDADALKILGDHRELLDNLPEGSVLTPHMKEFDYLFGAHETWWSRLQKAREQAVAKKCVIVLKNQYTFVVNQRGKVTINSTGNPAMAQGGMGDILTGLIVSFIAQGYDAEQASVIACYLHGLAGDRLAENSASVTASGVAEKVPVVLRSLDS